MSQPGQLALRNMLKKGLVRRLLTIGVEHILLHANTDSSYATRIRLVDRLNRMGCPTADISIRETAEGPNAREVFNDNIATTEYGGQIV
jgi:hypothetical protein